MTNYLDLTRRDFENWVESHGEKTYRGRQVFRSLWRPEFSDFTGLTDIPKALRKALHNEGRAFLPEVIQELRSADGTVKLALRLADGMEIETVLIPEKDHTTICLSTQVGCAMGCAFCHTARMGLRRNLSPGEIASQPLVAMKSLGLHEKPRNIVFMGMGEPLANLGNLLTALEILTDDLGLNYSTRRITVSTCGLIPEILRLGRAWDVGLAISLHASSDETRNRLMPINRKYPIPVLMEALKSYPLPRRRRITFEHLLLAGVNDSRRDAQRLVGLLAGLPAKLNLIPFNPGEGLPFEAPAGDDVLAFQEVLVKAGFTAIIRKSKGSDIQAACGQLFRCRQMAPAREIGPTRGSTPIAC